MNTWLIRINKRPVQLQLLLLAWVAVQGALFFSYRIKPILESEKYIYAARYLISNGHFTELRYYFYLTTTLVIALCLKTGLGFGGVVFFQLVCNLLATYCFYTSLYKLQQKLYSALLATLLLIFCIPYQTWNFYLYTESFFYSFILLFFAYCLRPARLSFRIIAIQFLLLAIVVVSRPLGILFLPCWIIFLVEKSPRRVRPPLIIAFISGMIVLAYISNLILGNIGDWKILTSAENNEIICDMPIGIKLNLDVLKNKPPVAQLFAYIRAYPLHFGKLAVERFRYFLLLTRPYYSQLHNLFLSFLCLVLYVPILLNVFWAGKNGSNIKPVAFPVAIILVFCAAICLQCDDYHNRFHHAIIPVFLYCGVFFFIEKLPFDRTLKLKHSHNNYLH